MKTQAILIDRDIWPDECHQIPLVHDLSRALDERDKNVKSPAAQLDRTAALLEKPFGHGQSKAAEQDDIFFRSNSDSRVKKPNVS
jgi:hypothetical protein